MSTEDRLARIEQLLLMATKNVLNIKEIAIMLGVSESRVRHLIADKAFLFYKQGSRVFAKKTDVEQWMLNTRYDSAAEIESKASTYCTSARNIL